MAGNEERELTAPKVPGGRRPSSPGDPAGTGAEAPRTAVLDEPDPAQVEPTDNSAGTPVDIEKLEAVEGADRASGPRAHTDRPLGGRPDAG